MCSNTVTTGFFNPPLYSVFEDKPFGSEMCHGRGVCDTDPIPKHIMKSCIRQDGNYVVTPTMSVEGIASHTYSEEEQKPFLIAEQRDSNRDDHIKKEFQKVLATLFQDPRKRINEVCKEIRRTIKRSFAKDSCDDCSSEGSSIPHTPYPSIASINSPMEHSYSSQDPRTSDKKMLIKKESKVLNLKPVGPFTEPPNPGKQMKLGEPYHDHSRMEKNFYNDY